MQSNWQLDQSEEHWLGLDVGGANLKFADGRGAAWSFPFELWRRPNELAEAIRQAVTPHLQDSRGLALTMTGELADCYPTKAEGVCAILAATEEAATGQPILVATTDDRWLTPDEARQQPIAVAAANWRVAARLVAISSPEPCGVWLDIGSTTVDVIPWEAGRVTARGATDTQRLVSGELVYTGVRRTPVPMVLQQVVLGADGERLVCPVAAELFATTDDAWLVLGEVAERPESSDTADGRPRTVDCATARLARCVCADSDSVPLAVAVEIADQIADEQSDQVASALERVSPGARSIVVSGEGEFLARRLLGDHEVSWVSAFAGVEASKAFPAHAAAVLASREVV